MSDEVPSKDAGKGGLSLSSWIMIGLGVGLVAGLFFGEYCRPLKVFGDIFIGLLQMSIMPYMIVSLVHGIGQLTAGKAGLLAWRAGILLLITWVLTLGVIVLAPLAFPSQESGSFFSSSIVEEGEELDVVSTYIPVNPFNSMAQSLVPAVVVFSLAFGVALIHVPNKKNILELLGTVTDTLSKLTVMVVRLTPIGVFFITASAAGTMSGEEFGRLNVYTITFVLLCLFMTFWLLPMMVSALTPFRYKEMFHVSRDALVTGFTTGNLFIVLPVLTEGARKLFENHKLNDEDTDSYVEVLVPTSFNFPSAGKLLVLIFILFAGWFTGSSLSLGQYPGFLVMGLLTLFGGVDMALPYLLDQMRLPADMYQLYVVSGIVTGRFATLLAAMNLFAFTLMATCACRGNLTLRRLPLVRFAGGSLVVLVACLLLGRVGLGYLVGDGYDKAALVQQMRIAEPAEVTYVDYQSSDIPQVDRTLTPLERILQRGSLRVGYRPDAIPFSFRNGQDELVGISIELAHLLAKDLGVSLEFVPAKLEDMVEMLENGSLDLAASVAVFPEYFKNLNFSEAYMEVTAAIVCRDHERHRYKSIENLRQMKELTLGISTENIPSKINEYLPNARFVTLPSQLDFFEGKTTNITAILTSAEAGSASTLLYPEFNVVVPQPNPIQAPVAFAVHRSDDGLIEYLDDWIRYKQGDGTLREVYDYWVLGRNIQPRQPRWSVIRNVLKWVD